jgi:outer membrane protein insertion porin family
MNRLQLSVFFALAFSLCWVVLSSGQQKGPQKIASIVIRFDGHSEVNPAYVLKNLSIEKGMDYAPNLIDKSIENLMSMGQFENVRVFRDEDHPDPSSVALVFLVTPKLRIKSIDFIGNDKISSRKLKKKIAAEQGLPLSEQSIKSDEQAIRDYYLKKGYWSVQVGSDILREEASGRATIAFRIDEGDKRRISEIAFEGNPSLKSRSLRKVMKTSKWRFFSFLTGSGRYKPSELEEDLTSLRRHYHNEGFLDVQLDQSDVQLLPDGRSGLRILIQLTEGKRYQVGKIRVKGNVLFDADEILKDLKLKTGEFYSPDALEKDKQAIRRKYGGKGYLDARVIAIRTPNLTTGSMDVTFNITENNSFKLQSVKIDGNDKTKGIVILRELALAPGDVFDLNRMDTSAARLRNTGFFSHVNIDDEPLATDDKELSARRRNMRITIKEQKTGNLTFGAGISSLEKAIVYAEIRQGNFDLFNWRGGFQGDGQKFRLRLQLGSRSSQAILSFEEPWFLEHRLALGFELFRTQSDYYSAYYDELRSGAEIYLRRRLFELVEGRLFYRFEDVTINDVQPLAPFWIQKQAGNTNVSKLGVVLTRDTRDSMIFPTEGSRTQISQEFAGGPFGGNSDYGKFELRGAKFIKTSDTLEQVFSLMGRVGTISEFDGDTVPFFEQFFLGGPYTLRGFDYRDVGPLDQTTREPGGGHSYGFLSLEYTFRVAEPLRLAVFYDGGFVNEGDFDFNPTEGSNPYRAPGYFDNWGMGVRIMVMGAPMRLDLGFPITDPTGMGKSSQFNFSFGTRF